MSASRVQNLHGWKSRPRRIFAYNKSKMQESNLLKLAIIVAVLGLIVLAVISSTSELDATNTYDIGRSQLNKDVRIVGEVSSVKELDKMFFVEVSQQKPVTVIVFKDGKEKAFAVGNEVDITGQLREYKGKMEIIAEKVKAKEKSQ